MCNMSIKALGWAIKKNCNTPTTKLVLFILSNYADENDSCYPSEKHLAQLCGITDRSVRRCLKWLEENNFLQIEHTEGKSNRYHLLISTMDTHVHTHRTLMSTNTKDDTKNNIRSKRQEVSNKNFENFWKNYPRKVAKKKARDIFLRIEIEKQEKVIEQTINFKNYTISNKTEMRFIPHPATWLNQERWEDVVETSKNKKQTLNNIAG